MKTTKVKLHTFFILFFITVSVQAQLSENISLRVVKTKNGLLSGRYNADKTVMIFKGIPYSAAPVGKLRWKEPQPVKNWKGIRRAEKFGPCAIQDISNHFNVYTDEFLIPRDSKISEDCLYLNIWCSSKSTKEKKPVIVYIHGGGFSGGSGSVPIYDGEAMAKKGVAFVTFNYRLGVFGFFAHPELTKESPHCASGNYGLMDQIAALKWVKENIASFGGDPNNVTIAGQSSGALSVNILSASTVAQGLFNKIIAESGANVIPAMLGEPLSLVDAEKIGIQIQKSAKANTLEELRKMSVNKLMSLCKGVGLLNIDGYVITEPISSSYASRKNLKVPLLTGYNANDNFLTAITNLAVYKQTVKHLFPKDSATLLNYYPAITDDEANLSSSRLYRDMVFGVQQYAWACMQSEDDNSNVYMYFFNRNIPEAKGENSNGAFHTGEVMYAYNNFKSVNRALTEDDHKLADLMSSYWIEFAKKGDPNRVGLPFWPSFKREKGEVMIFDVNSKSNKHPYLKALDFLYQKSIN